MPVGQANDGLIGSYDVQVTRFLFGILAGMSCRLRLVACAGWVCVDSLKSTLATLPTR